MLSTITTFITKAGYLGIFLLMLVENIFPPIPSEMIMPFAGYVAAEGSLSLVSVILAGAFGSLAGVWFWYELARWLGPDRLRKFAARHGRWLTMSPADLDRADTWFDAHAGKMVLLGRLIPGIRTLISVPAGVFGMPRVAFLAYSALGTAIWAGALAFAGFHLRADFVDVGAYVDPVSTGIMAILVSVYLYRVITWSPHR